MYCIGICDDDEKYLSVIEKSTRKYFAEKQIDNYEISTFQNPDDLLISLNKSIGYDILLLDICMPGLDGTSLVREIKAAGYKTEVIFLTTSRDYAVDAFALQVSNYILKPFEYSVFKDAIDNVLSKLEREKLKYVTVKTLDGLIRVPLLDLIYVESQGNYLNLNLVKNETIRIRDTIKSFYQLLSKVNNDFVLCGASYIVNIGHIHKINPKELTLANGLKLTIPRGGYPDIKEKYFEYYFKTEE